MPTVEGMTADHHKYVVDGIIDDEVVQRQSRTQLEKLNETTIIHYHKHNEPCGGRQHRDFLPTRVNMLP